MTAALARLNGRTFASLRLHRNYRLFFFGQIVSNTGTWMQRIAQAWLVLQLDNSPVAVGGLVLCQYLPFTLFGLFAGVLVDRLDARRTVIGTQTASMVLAGAMAGISVSGVATLWMVYVIAFLMGTALVLDAPARQALTYQMVGRDELPNAVALNSSIFNGARVFGPAVAGVSIALVGVGACFAANAASFVAVLVSLLLMRADELYPLVRGARPTLLRGAREGLSYARHNREVGLVLGMTLILATLCFNFHVLLPVLAKQTLDAGPGTFGVISAFFGAGALLGALVVAFVGRASWRALLAGGVGFGLCELVLAPERSVAVACVVLLFTGACFTVWTAVASTIAQLAAPDHLRGRVASLYLYAMVGTAPLGGLLVGWLCDRGGTRLALAVAGATALALTGYAAIRMRRGVLTKRFTNTFESETAA